VLGVPSHLGEAIRQEHLTVRNTIIRQMKSKQGKWRRLEIHTPGECATLALAMSAIMCEDAGDEWPAPKHYNAVFGRPDEEQWVAAMDKEVIKIVSMGPEYTGRVSKHHCGQTLGGADRSRNFFVGDLTRFLSMIFFGEIASNYTNTR